MAELEKLSYSEKMANLEEIVAKLQRGTDLEETLKLFEQGKLLYNSCALSIKEAENALEKHEKEMMDMC